MLQEAHFTTPISCSTHSDPGLHHNSRRRELKQGTFLPPCFSVFGFLQDVESFVREVALGFMPSFLPIAERRGREPFSEKQRQWQLMRRGRYLEFNLLYDRGRLDLDRDLREALCTSTSMSIFLQP